MVSLDGKTHLVMIELCKAENLTDLKKKTKEELWAYFIRNCPELDKRNEINELLRHEGGMRMAMKTLLTISKDENERARLLTMKKNVLDWQSGIASARKEERRKSAAIIAQLNTQNVQLNSQNVQLNTQVAQQAAEIAALKELLGKKQT
jgi:hypothetical protein